MFYNPNYKNDMETEQNSNADGDWFYAQNRMCANFVYDLNELKGPNKVDRDIGFITALYAKNSEVVSPIPFKTEVDNLEHSQQEAIDLCTNYSDDARLPNKHELSSLFYNKDLIGNMLSGLYWSSSSTSSVRAWDQDFRNGNRLKTLRSFKLYVRCVRK